MELKIHSKCGFNAGVYFPAQLNLPTNSGFSVDTLCSFTENSDIPTEQGSVVLHHQLHATQCVTRGHIPSIKTA